MITRDPKLDQALSKKSLKGIELKSVNKLKEARPPIGWVSGSFGVNHAPSPIIAGRVMLLLVNETKTLGWKHWKPSRELSDRDSITEWIQQREVC